MERFFFTSFLVLALSFYVQSQDKKTPYSKQVGDSSFDITKDDPLFKVCSEERIAQYYSFGKGLQYRGEKKSINNAFAEQLTLSEKKGENGFITIRFIVSCNGKTGRFRIQEMDNNYQPKAFDKSMVSQLLEITKRLNGWIIGEYEGILFDYYQYLTFKIENGLLIEIMP